MIGSIGNKLRMISSQHYLISVFIIAHIYFAVVIDEVFVFAPDEVGYIFTFNNVYTLPINTNAQAGSGWITAPTLFLWILLFPAKILNVLGITDVISLRILSIVVTSFCLHTILRIQKSRDAYDRFPKFVVCLSFMIPSVFLWTTLSMREPFIIFFLTLFFSGLYEISKFPTSKSYIYLLFGSYGLLSTKPYLWILLILSVLISLVLNISLKRSNLKIGLLVLAGLFLSLLGFLSTTSTYALNFIFDSKISETSERSGDSITEVTVETSSEPSSETITFHGDYTLVALHSYLLDHPNSFFSQILKALTLDRVINRIWDEKIAMALLSEDGQVGVDQSSLNSHILQPASIADPISIIRASAIFLFGPFPIFLDYGFAPGIAALESPIWWALYIIVFFQIMRFSKRQLFTRPEITIAFVFLLGEVVFSALVEVNLGTSFRHRSIILIPLIYLYVMCKKEVLDVNKIEKH